MYIYMIVNTIDRSIDRIFASFLNHSQFKIIFTILFSSSFEIKLDKNPNSNHVRENIPREGEINRKKNRNVRLIDRSKTRRRLYTFFRVHFQSFRNFPWFSSPRGNRIVKGRPRSASISVSLPLVSPLSSSCFFLQPSISHSIRQSRNGRYAAPSLQILYHFYEA